jgi:trimethyllysine dioxygenase
VISLTSVDTNGVVVCVDRHSMTLSWTWLRDHALDAESFLASAQQRLVTPATIAAVGVGQALVGPEGLEVSWPAGPTTVFAAEFLATLADPAAMIRVGPDPEPWTGAQIARRMPRLPHHEFAEGTDGLRTALDTLWRHGIVVLAGVPVDTATTRSTLERFGYIRSTIFGDLWEFSSDGGFDDTASTPLEITPHTDGTYSHDAPGLLGLHCHVYEAQGGENVFVDGHAIAERLSTSSRDVLSTVEIPGRYIGDGSHLMAKRPALRYDGPRLVQVSYNHHDRAPFLLPEPLMSEVYAALFEFDALANDPALQLDVEMRPGDMVIFDNWRLLHGRRAFVGERLIAGGYINREDVEATTRLVG